MQANYQGVEIVKIPEARIGILQAEWHRDYTDRMVAACVELLKGAGAELELFTVPGSYELPLAAKRLAKSGRYDALIVFGAIVKGETDHYQVILDTCIRELGRVMYDYEIPVIMEVLPVHKLEHLAARSEGDQNKGIEAAQAAAATVRWHRDFDERLSSGRRAGFRS